VIGIFKQKNPGNAFVLLLYGLVIKFPFFLHPEKYAANEGDNYIFNVIVKSGTQTLIQKHNCKDDTLTLQ